VVVILVVKDVGNRDAVASIARAGLDDPVAVDEDPGSAGSFPRR
jgi:hypothetical protein